MKNNKAQISWVCLCILLTLAERSQVQMTFKAAILSNTYSVNFIPDAVLLCLNLPHLHRFCAIVMYQNFMLDLYIFCSIRFVKFKCVLYSGYHWEGVLDRQGVCLIHGYIRYIPDYIQYIYIYIYIVIYCIHFYLALIVIMSIQ